MRTTVIALVTVASGIFGACEGSEVRRPLSADGFVFDADGDDADAVQDGDDGQDGEDGQDGDDSQDGDDGQDGDVTPREPSVEFWLVGRNGERGRGVDSVTVEPDDELEENLASAGFQTQITVATVGVADGTEVRFFVGDFTQGTSVVAVDPDGDGSAIFLELTLPDTGSTIVRVEAVDVAGDPLTASKTVTVDAGACIIEAELRLGTSGCVELDPNAVVAPFQAATIAVQRVSGPCQRVGGAARVGVTNVTLAQTSFTAGGSAELLIPIDPSSSFQGDITFELTAVHPDDTTQNGTASGVARFDRTNPVITWIAPAPDVTKLTLADDSDGDSSNGIQFEVRVDLGLAANETATAVLSQGNVDVGEVTATGPGAITFGQITFDEDGPLTVRVVVVDACDNRGTAVLDLDVSATPQTLAILTPRDGAVLLAAADGDSTTPDVYETRFDVSADAATVGTRISLLCQAATNLDPEDMSLVGELVVASVSQNGTYAVPVAVDTAVFGQATRCVARMTTPIGLVSDPVRITFAIPAPTISITLPASACITGSTIGFSGTATGLDGLTLSATGTPPAPRPGEGADGPIDIPDFAVVGSGAASGDWSATYQVGDADGLYAWRVAGSDRFGNFASDAQIGVTIDRTLPVTSITSPAGPIDGTLTPDGDAARPGYQANVVVAVSERTSLVGGEVCLAVNGAAPACQAMGNAVAFVGVTLAAGDNLLTVTSRDGCSNEGVAVQQTVTLTLDNPIAIVAPASSTLLAAGDLVTATTTTYDFSVTVDADRAAAGATLAVECRAAGSTDFTNVGSSTIAAVADSGVYAITVAVDTLALGTTVECRARVDLPSVGVSDIVSYVLALPRPTLALTAPVANGCVRGAIAASGTATSLDGQVVTASLVRPDGDVLVSNTATAATGAFTTTLALGTTGDGTYGVIASATDAFGNPASTGTAVVVAIDRTAPLLAITAPAATEIVEADDTSIAAGIQVDVVASYSDARVGGQVCLAVGVATAVCLPAAATVTFDDVTLQPGDNTLTLSGTDACGNPATPVIVTRRLELDAPIVAITTPVADLTTAATTIDIVVSVTDSDLVPLTGLTVVLLKGGVATGISAVGADNGTYTFSAVPLTAGTANAFTAEAERANAVKGTSTARIITQKNTSPTIAITAPTNGTLFVVSSAACAVGQASCVTTVTATTTNVEDSSAATLSVVCGAATVVYNANVSASAASFANVTLTNGQSCTLTPGVTDVAAQTATGTAVTVTVDRTAPTVAITSPGAILQASDDADALTAGLQYPLSATIGGVAAGATVTAVISWNDGAPQTKTLTHVVATLTADGGSYVASFQDLATPGLVTWPDGTVTVVVSVSDVNGNSTSTTLQLAVAGATSIRITGPALIPVDTCGAGCAAGTSCQDGACWIAWGLGAARQLVTIVAGIQTTTNNVRVCSDDPALAGTGAATCASPASATGRAYRQVRIASTTGGTTILDVSTGLSETHQRLVAEVLPVTGGAWISSLDSVSANERVRRVDVDLQAPGVSTITSPSDTLPPTGTLNAAEQAAVPRAYDITFTVSEAGRAEVYVAGSVVLTQDVPAGATTVRVTLPEGTPQVWVVMSDAVGNRSATSPGLGAVTYQPTVDVTAPTLTFTRPSKSPLRQGDILDVVLTSNADGRTVTLFDGATRVASAPVAGGGVTFSDASFDIMTEGSHTLSATVSDAAGNVAPATTTPATVVVDTVPPAGTIIAPINLADLAEADDASATTPGYQVAVTFATSGGAATWSLSTAKGCTSAFSGCLAPVEKATGPATNGTEPITLITLDLDAALTRHKIILTTRDAAGNSHTTEIGVTVFVNCSVSFRNLPISGWYNQTTCGSSTNCNNVQIEVGIAGNCGDALELFDGSTPLGLVNQPNAVELFSITITNGTALSLEAVAYSGNINNTRGSTGYVAIGVDLEPPLVAFIADTVQGFTTPAEGASVSYDFADDLDPGTAGMQLNAAVRVTDANADAGIITSLTATSTAGTVNLTPTNATFPLTLHGTSPITQTLLRLTLVDDLTHTVVVTATDAAGNSDTGTFTATVDVTAPPVVPITNMVVDPRRPRFSLTWTAIGLDGAPAASYGVRYSDQPIVSEADWNAACDGSLVFGSDPMPSPAAEGTPMSVAIGGPDNRAFTDACKLDVRFDNGEPAADVALFFAVRAFDGVGNGSPINDTSTIEVSNAELWNEVSAVRFSNTGVFGSNVLLLTRRGTIIGDINDDGIPDWVTNSFAANGYCVMLGRTDQPAELTITTKSSSNHTCFLGSDVAALFPDISPAPTQTGHLVQGLGDLNGDGIDDFGVSAKTFNGASGAASAGYVAVYFGRSPTVQGDLGLPNLASPNLLIRGLRAFAGNGEFLGFCSPGDFDGITSNALLTSDLVVTEPFANVAYVIPGNGAWTAATHMVFRQVTGGLSTDGGATLFNTWSVGGTFTNPTATTAGFGTRCTGAGDLLPTPTGSGVKADLLLLQSGGPNPSIFLFPGREWTGVVATTVTETLPAMPTGEDALSLRLRQEAAPTTVAGFGVAIQGDIDLTGDGIADVIASNPGRRPSVGDGKSVSIFDGSKLAPLVGTDVRVISTGNPVNESWTGINGWVLRSDIVGQPFALRAIGNFDGVFNGDIAIGNNIGTTIALRLNRAAPADSIVLGQFPVIDGQAVNRYQPAANGIGLWIDGADLNQDGMVDIITGSNLGEVLIFH